MKKLNIVFAGTPAFGLPALEAIANSTHRLKAVYTQPDRPAGRGQKIQISPIKQWALEHHIPVEQPINFKDPMTVEKLRSWDIDVMVVIAYGIILPETILTIPRYGCLNVHASLLPKYRGAAPIQRAILNRENQTGITLMQMDKGMDTGPMLKHIPCTIEPNDTAETLHNRLAQLSVQPLINVLDNITSQTPITQDHSQATYAAKIQKADAMIAWDQPAEIIHAHIRGFNPWPVAYTYLSASIPTQTMRVFEATIDEFTSHKANNSVKPGTILEMNPAGIRVATQTKDILIHRIQFPGGKILNVSEWAKNQQSKPQISPGLVLS